MGVQPSGLVITGRADEVLLNASLVTPRNKARTQFLQKKYAKPKVKPQPKPQPVPVAKAPQKLVPCPQNRFSVLAEGEAVQPNPDQEALPPHGPAPVPVRKDSAVRQLVFLLSLAAVCRVQTGEGERMEEVACAVLARHGVSLAEVRGPRRARALVRVRFEAQYAVRARCRVSLSEMARFFRRDHTSILSATESWAERNGLPKPWKEGWI